MESSKAALRTIAQFFDKNGLVMQADAAKFLEALYPGLGAPALEKKLAAFLTNIYSIFKQTGKENTLIVSRELLEEALKLGVEDPAKARLLASAQDFRDARSMDLEAQAPETTGFVDKISQKIATSLIVLSNFGEVPSVCFRNQARELTVQHGRPRGILVGGKELIERAIERYHKMRFLIKNSGQYVYQHELSSRNVALDSSRTTVLHEIGTLSGNRGSFTIFGLVFKKGRK